jgi:glycosyltransferase involved in cell wall biosynthesis
MSGAPRISLVIPAYNEAAYLPQLLDSVDGARGRYIRGADAVEVIVADNASTDATTAIAAARGCRVARVEKRVIGAARNGGTRIARGEFLAFVDADLRIHPETFNEIDRALSSDRVVAGATGAWPDRWSPGIAAIMLVLLPLGALLRLDIGVVFCRRRDFEAIGGYTEEWLYAEDVRFLLALRRLGWRRRQRVIRGGRARGIASTRKFDKHGDWHYMTMPIRLGWDLLRHPQAARVWALRYWYEDR